MGDASRPGYDVFISHSSQDKTWADAACAILERHRVRCWMAPRNIVPGTEWGAAIIGGIDACRVMVVIFSGQANASAQVRREVERAISKGLAVLPVRIEDVRPEGAMEYALGNTHWLDAFTPPMERQMETLAASVRTLLGVEREANPFLPLPDATPPEIPPRRRLPTLVAVAAVLVAAAALAVAMVAFRPKDVKSPVEGVEVKAEPKVQPPVGTKAGVDPKSVADRAKLPPAEPTIDVLAMIKNPDAMSKNPGAWKRLGEVLISNGGEHDILRLPVDVPESYRLDIKISRRGDAEFWIGFPFGKAHGLAVIDGWGGTISGLSWIDGKAAADNETRHEGAVFSKTSSVELSLIVRRRRASLMAGGTPIFRWGGEESSLTGPAGRRPIGNRLILTANGGRFRIEKMTLTPLLGP